MNLFSARKDVRAGGDVTTEGRGAAGEGDELAPNCHHVRKLS